MKHQEEGNSEQNSIVFAKQQSEAELIERVKENLEKARKVLSESGAQLGKNTSDETFTADQSIHHKDD